MSVNRPTNVKQKEADVNQKLQLYGIYSGKSNMHHHTPSILINYDLAFPGLRKLVDDLIRARTMADLEY